MNNKVIGGGNESSPLSPFEIGLYIFTTIAPIFFWSTWDLNIIQSMVFVFGVFALYGLSLISPKYREYDNKLLGIMILWSLACVFIHSFKFSLLNSVISTYINFAIISEGFIYIFCGSMLFKMIISYTKGFKIVYPLIVINTLNLLFVITQKLHIPLIWSNVPTICGMFGTKGNLTIFSALSIPILARKSYALTLIPITCMFFANSYTGILALFIATIIYLKRTNQIERMVFVIISGLYFIVLNFNSMWVKFLVRWELFNHSLREIFSSMLIGKGFDITLANNKVFCILENGMTFRHNDLMNIAVNLGVPFAIMISLLVWRILKKSKIDYLWVSCLILTIGCCFQTSFYFTRIASIGIVLFAIKELDNAGNL